MKKYQCTALQIIFIGCVLMLPTLLVSWVAYDFDFSYTNPDLFLPPMMRPAPKYLVDFFGTYGSLLVAFLYALHHAFCVHLWSGVPQCGRIREM